MAAISFSTIGINGGAYTGEEVAIGGTAVGITAALLDPTDHATNGRPQYALISNTHATEAFRYRLDGTDPTASIGHPVAAGDSILLQGITALRRFRAIQTIAGSEMFITLFR